MSENDSNIPNDDKDIIRLSITDLIAQGLPDEITGTDDANKALPQTTTNQVYDSILKRSEGKAKKTLNSLLKFYVSEDIISNDEYVSSKMEIEQMALTNLIYLMETSEKAMTRLLNTIDAGSLEPRMFEVLAGLQKTMLDIIKSQTMYMMAAEEGAKKIGRDYEMYQGQPAIKGNKSVSNKNIKTRGTKDLMKALQEMKSKENKTDNNIDEITDVTDISDEPENQ